MHERFSDPNTGVKMRRTLQGSCLCGKLVLKRSAKAAGTDLYWVGKDIEGAFSFDLRELIVSCWHKMRRQHPDDAPAMPPPQPLQIKPHVYWLARLPHNINYRILERDGGGCELFAIEIEITQPQLTRPTRSRADVMYDALPPA